MTNKIMNHVYNGFVKITREDSSQFAVDKKETGTDFFLAIPRKIAGKVIQINKDHSSHTLPSVSKINRFFHTFVFIIFSGILIPITFIAIIVAAKSDSRKDAFAMIANHALNPEKNEAKKVIEDSCKINEEKTDDKSLTNNLDSSKDSVLDAPKTETISEKQLNLAKEKTAYENLKDTISELKVKLEAEKNIQVEIKQEIKENEAQINKTQENIKTENLNTSYSLTTQLERELYKQEIKFERCNFSTDHPLTKNEIDKYLTKDEEELIDQFNAATIKALGGIDSFIKLKAKPFILPKNWTGVLDDELLDDELKDQIQSINQPIIWGKTQFIEGKTQSEMHFLIFNLGVYSPEGKSKLSSQVLLRRTYRWFGSSSDKSQLCWGDNDGIIDGSPEEKYMIERWKRLFNGEKVGKLKSKGKLFTTQKPDVNTIKDSRLKGEELDKFFDISTAVYEQDCSDGTYLLLIKPQEEANIEKENETIIENDLKLKREKIPYEKLKDKINELNIELDTQKKIQSNLEVQIKKYVALEEEKSENFKLSKKKPIQAKKQKLMESRTQTTRLERELYKLQIKLERCDQSTDSKSLTEIEIDNYLTKDEEELINNFNAATIKTLGGIDLFKKLQENPLIVPEKWTGFIDGDLKKQIEDINQSIILGQTPNGNSFLIFNFNLYYAEKKRWLFRSEVLFREKKDEWSGSIIDDPQLCWGCYKITDGSPEEKYMLQRWRALFNHEPVGRLKLKGNISADEGPDINNIQDARLKKEELSKFFEIRTMFYEEDSGTDTHLLLIEPQNKKNIKDEYYKYFPQKE